MYRSLDGDSRVVIKKVAGVGLRRLLFLMGATLLFITMYAAVKGRDCDSGSTERWSPDLHRDQIQYVEDHYPGSFAAALHVDEYLLNVVAFSERQSQQRLDEEDVAARHPHERLFFIDVGANLGRISFHILRTWGTGRAQSLRQLFQQYSPHHPSDAVLRHKLKLVALEEDEREETEPSVVVHAFEVDPEESDALTSVAAHVLPVNSLRIHRVAVVDQSLAAASEVPLFMAEEGTTLARLGEPTDFTVPTVTLDQFLEENHLSSVHFCKIDVEGLESRVLSGMRKSLKLKKIQYFHFDYGHKWLKKYTGQSQSYFLKDEVQKLYDLQYICYLVGRHRLIRLSPPYWSDSYEFHQRHHFVNVVVACFHQDNPTRHRVLKIYNEIYFLDDPFD